MDWRLFFSLFALIFVAELPGKSTLASFLLAARTRPLPVFLGACAAYIVHSAIAVAAGSLVGLLPVRPVQVAVGMIFLILAVILWRHREQSTSEAIAEKIRFSKTLATAFTVVFIAQWGDPTQIATAALAAKYAAATWTVFLSATLALWAVTGLAVIIGHHAKAKFHPAMLQKIASVIFAGVGLVLLAQAIRHP